jgi:DUF438 domain-containing protein
VELAPDWLTAILDSLADPLMFVDTDHVIRYMNRAALAHYRQGAALLGTSLMDCHNEQSQAALRRILAKLEAGETEVLYAKKPEVRLYMRAVRDAEGRLLGYIERRERIGD